MRIHSGWAAMAAVVEPLEVLDRRRLVCIDDAVPGARQPYHFVEAMELGAAERHLAHCAEISGSRAVEQLQAAVRDLTSRDVTVSRAAILEAGGRPLPELARILASHALIHAAEGEFFRSVFRRACQTLGIPVTGIRAAELVAAPAELCETVNHLGRHLGPPWTQDQKQSALAAFLVLSAHRAALL